MIKRWLRRERSPSRESDSVPPSPEIRYVVTNIYGDVVNSQIIVGGGDVNPSRVQHIAGQGFNGGADRVLFCQSDYEMLDISGIIRNRSLIQSIERILNLELRILVLAIPLEGTVVIPPTYYFESSLCQDLMRTHATFIDHGFVKLLSDYVDLKDYLERKRDRYSKAAHFPRYKDAYYTNKDHGVYDLNFQLTEKSQSVGKGSLNLWSKIISDRAKQIGYPSGRIDEFRRLVLDTERMAFLHENVAEHMATVGITRRDASLLLVREIKSKNYLVSYISQGICVPEGSMVVSDLLVPKISRQKYNINSWRRIFEVAGVLEKIYSCEPSDILKIKMKPEVAMIIAKIREKFSRGKTSDLVIGDLMRNNLWDIFVNQITQT